MTPQHAEITRRLATLIMGWKEVPTGNPDFETDAFWFFRGECYAQRGRYYSSYKWQPLISPDSCNELMRELNLKKYSVTIQLSTDSPSSATVYNAGCRGTCAVTHWPEAVCRATLLAIRRPLCESSANPSS